MREPWRAGSAEADLWPHRKGMWKLFHPRQEPKTPGRLESGASSRLSAVLIRGKKPKLRPNAPLRVCGGGFCHFDRSCRSALVLFPRINHFLRRILFWSQKLNGLWPLTSLQVFVVSNQRTGRLFISATVFKIIFYFFWVDLFALFE